MRLRLMALLCAGVLSLIAGGATAKSWVVPLGATADPIIAAAGDISCDPGSSSFNNGNGTSSLCRQKFTAGLLQGVNAVLPLGDLQYEDATLDKFTRSYALSWGVHKAITRPAVGNHEYLTSGAGGYFSYFGAAAGESGKGYYAFDLGQWRLIALNSNCSQAGGCGTNSPQTSWLRTELARTTKPCILAYWHHPRFSSGEHGSSTAYSAFWQALYIARADVVLVAHDHTYERFAQQNPNGQADPVGIRQFVVGTGGKSHYPFPNVLPTSQVRNNTTYGVLKLALHASSYDWQYVPESGNFTDAGTTACNPAGPTAVTLSSLSATRTRTGVVVKWRTASETQTLGFNLYRDRAGRLTKVNRTLIPASGMGRGHVYAWVDRIAGLRYRLQSIGSDGARRWLGSARVSARP